MKHLLTATVVCLLITASHAEDKKPDALNALEKKLLGVWSGPACGGDYTFNADGTFVMVNFTPGGNKLTGTWSIRWDALPPTLVLIAKTSDFTTKPGAGNRQEYEYLNKPLEVKLLELNDKSFRYKYPNGDFVAVWARDEVGAVEKQ
jgi:hypothetical protein